MKKFNLHAAARRETVIKFTAFKSFSWVTFSITCFTFSVLLNRYNRGKDALS